jgi:predicted permease
MAMPFQDVRYAVRLLKNNPGFTIAAVLSLALGIGANTAVFSIMDAVMLKQLPVERPDELVKVALDGDGPFTNPIWEQLRDRQQVFSGAFAWSTIRLNLAKGGEIDPARGVIASGGYFSTLGVLAAAGRTFSVEDDKRGCNPVAVLSHEFWQRRFGGRGDAVGRVLMLDGKSFDIIGVAQAGFFGVDVGERFDVAIPMCTEPSLRSRASQLDDRSAWWLSAMARPKGGVTSGQAEAHLKVIAPGVFEATVPEDWPGNLRSQYLKHSFEISSGAVGLSGVRKTYGDSLAVLMAVAGIVLLIACANVANLMLARAAVRQKEIRVRLALGASQWRVLRQLLTEGLALSVLSATLGVAFAYWGSRILVTLISTSNSLVYLDLAIDRRLLGFTAAVSFLTGILFALAPAFRLTRTSLNVRGVGQGSFRLGKALVAVQVAMSLLLLAGAGLFVRTFINLMNVDSGFEKSNVLLVDVDIRPGNYPAARRNVVFDDLLRRIRTVPGVQSASRSLITPVSGMGWNGAVHAEGFQPKSRRESIAWFNGVSPDYFATLGTPLRAGREFTDRDTLSSPKVAIVNETVARKFFAGKGNVLGQVFQTSGPRGKLGERIEIVGVVKDAKYRALSSDNVGTVYFPSSQELEPGESTTMELRTAMPPGQLTAAVKSAAAEFDSRIFLQFKTLAAQVTDSVAQQRALALLAGFFAVLALLLAAVGLYGVISYRVTCRRNEIGIRSALGAGRGSIQWLVLREVMVLLAVGVAGGTLASSAISKYVKTLLFGLPPDDKSTVVMAACLLVSVALVAGAIPARRAAKIDPMQALREE